MTSKTVSQRGRITEPPISDNPLVVQQHQQQILAQAMAINPQVQPAQTLAYATPPHLPPEVTTMGSPASIAHPNAADLFHAQLYTLMQQCNCPLCQQTLGQWNNMAQHSRSGDGMRRTSAPASLEQPLIERIGAAAALLNQQQRH
jgi:hypothetical protein